MAITPPSELNQTFGDNNRRTLSEGKQKKGYNIGEAPGARHMNYVLSNTASFQYALAKALAPQIAFNNFDYTATSTGPANAADNFHVDYDSLADKFYGVGIDTSGNQFAVDSADGITWSANKNVVNVGAGAYGDVSKIVSDGTNCMMAADNGSSAQVFKSSSLLVAGFPAGGVNVTGNVTSSDLVWDAGNSLWIWCGQNSTPRGTIFTSPAGTTWTSRYTEASATNMISLATDGQGNSFAQNVSGGGRYSSNGTTWNASTTSPGVSNNVVWSESLQLFVCIANSNGAVWTSEDGDNWSDMNAVEGVPFMYNLVHCDDFVLAFTTDLGPSTNGLNYHDVYAFFTEATDRTNFNYTKIGQVWQDAGVVEAIPYTSALRSVYRCGQGKVVFPYQDTSATNDTRMMVAYYGGPDAF